MSKTARWCFTVNNPGMWRPVWTPDTMIYLIWQIEKGEAGTEHVQGYVRFKTRKFLQSAKLLLSDRAHLEPARGKESANRTYCTKPGGTETTENGEYDPDSGTQGRRSDLEAVTAAILKGTSLASIAREEPTIFVQYHNGLEKLSRLTAPMPDLERNVRCVVLWGDTGTGKSHRVRTSFPDIYSIRAGRGPFDMYNNQSTVLFDEFDFHLWPITEMNMYLDKWPCELNCRFFNKQAAWNNIYICANSDPMDWYPGENFRIRDAFFRRLTIIYEVKNKEEHFIL